jgi:hypothetical protein
MNMTLAASGSNDVADLVHHHERDALQPAELGFEPSLPVSVGQASNPLGGRGERHPVPREAGPDPERDRQVRLAGTGWSEKHHVATLGKEVELGKVQQHLARDGLLEAEVELVQGLASGEPCRTDPRLPSVGRPGQLLGREQLLGEALVGPRAVSSSLGEIGQCGRGGRGLESPEQGELGFGADGSTLPSGDRLEGKLRVLVPRGLR